MRRREILRSSALFTIGAVSASVLASCNNQTGSQPQAGGNNTSGNNAGGKAPLRVGLIPWVGWNGAHIADQKGFFKEAGVNVEQTVFQSVTEVNTALLSNKIDLAWLVAADLLVMSGQMPDLKFFFASDYSGEVDSIIGYGINSPADLKGKKFAREDIPYQLVFTNQYLTTAGLSENDVEMVSMLTPDSSAAFISGKVDVIASYEPFLGKALKERPGAKILHSAKDKNVIVNGVAASANVLKSRQADVIAYMKAISKGMKFTQDNPAEANEMLAKWTGVTAAEVKDQFTKIRLFDIEGNKAVVFNPNEPLNTAASLDAAAAVLMKKGKISKTIPGKDLIDDSIVKAV
jgi:NitT/TauT family transport system substrate-binding protein